MEQRLLKYLLIQLKVAAGLLLLGLLTLLLFSFTSAKLADDFWNQLGLSRDQGSDYISTGFMEGYINHYGAKNMKNIALSDRAQVVRDLGNYARQYVKNEKFLKAYEASREGSKPAPPPAAKTVAELRAELVAAVSQGIKTMEEFLNGPNAELKKMAQDGLPDLRKQLKDYQDPRNSMIKMMADGEKMNFEAQTLKYNDQLLKWEKDQPTDPKELIRNRLREFLNLTSDIDFNAQLKERNGRMIFVNPAFERKSSDWKKAFRSGKEAVTAARSFAQEWLKDLN